VTILNIQISQGNVETRLRQGWNFCNRYI